MSKNHPPIPSSDPFPFIAPALDPFRSAGSGATNPFFSRTEPTEDSAPGRDWSIEAWPAAPAPRDASGAPLVFSPEELTLQVVVTWGASVLSVAHLSPPRPFSIGVASGAGRGAGEKEVPVDVIVPEAALGLSRLWVVERVDEKVLFSVPQGAEGKYRDSTGTKPLSDCVSGAEAGASRVALEVGSRVDLKLKEIGVHLHLSRKLAPMPRGLSAQFETASVGYFGMTAGLAASLMLAMAYFAPPLGLEEDQGLQMNRQILLSQYLDAASEREQKAEEIPEQESGAEASGETGKRAEGSEGEAGKEDAPRVSARAAVKGPRDNTQLQIPRAEMLELARNFGMNELLGADSAVAMEAWTNPLGGDQLLGNQDVTAQGAMWGDMIGESGGVNGLGLLGKDFGGGALFGNGLGIGLGRDGVIGPGLGKDGFGRSNALTSKGHKVRTPSLVATGVTQVSGRLPPQVIQRTVRQNFGRFRMCYEAGLRQNPTLEGRIPVRFVIGSDGAVSNVSSPGGFADAGVQGCVLNAFYGLSFPSPEGGIVTVTYPLIFSPE